MHTQPAFDKRKQQRNNLNSLTIFKPKCDMKALLTKRAVVTEKYVCNSQVQFNTIYKDGIVTYPHTVSLRRRVCCIILFIGCVKIYTIDFKRVGIIQPDAAAIFFKVGETRGNRKSDHLPTP